MSFYRIFLLLFILNLNNAVDGQHIVDSSQFTLNGAIHQMNGKYLYLKFYSSDKAMRTDSALVTNDNFSFKGHIDQPVLAILLKRNLNSWRAADTTVTTFYLEPKSLNLTFIGNKFSASRLRGSVTNDDNRALDKLREKLMTDRRPLDEAYDNLNDKYIQMRRNGGSDLLLDSLATKMDSLRNELGLTNNELFEIDTQFFKTHPTSVVTAFELKYHLDELSSAMRYNFYQNLGQKTQNGRYGKQLKDRIDMLANGPINAIAREFELSGWRHPVKLSENKGKFVLLVFWASWCRPCRAENPELDSLYNTYRNRGLNIEFIGIGEDRNMDDWKAAIKKDQIERWQHGLSDQKNKDVANLYGVALLPTKILIDTNRRVIGRYVGDDNKELIEKLNSLLDRKGDPLPEMKQSRDGRSNTSFLSFGNRPAGVRVVYKW